MTQEQIRALAQAKLDEIKPEERIDVLLTVAQLLYPEDQGYVTLYKELRKFTREATDNLIQQGYGPIVQVEDEKDIESASATLAAVIEKVK